MGVSVCVCVVTKKQRLCDRDMKPKIVYSLDLYRNSLLTSGLERCLGLGKYFNK